jgi:ligand-binding SRPBCC domain-containing protein
MSFSTCPIDTVDAPIERVWQLLANPSAYALWWDARTRSILPPGPAQPGQQILADTNPPVRGWQIRITVQAVNPEKHILDLLTRLPLGITVHNHITCNSLDQLHTRLSFG